MAAVVKANFWGIYSSLFPELQKKKKEGREEGWIEGEEGRNFVCCLLRARGSASCSIRLYLINGCHCTQEIRDGDVTAKRLVDGCVAGVEARIGEHGRRMEGGGRDCMMTV
jgi:hypothetical protein